MDAVRHLKDTLQMRSIMIKYVSNGGLPHVIIVQEVCGTHVYCMIIRKRCKHTNCGENKFSLPKVVRKGQNYMYSMIQNLGQAYPILISP